MSGNTFSGASAGWSTLPPIRSSSTRVENTRSTPGPHLPSIPQQIFTSALPPMSQVQGPASQLSGSVSQRLTRAPAPPNPFLIRRPMPFGNSLQRLERNLPPPNPIQRMRVPLPSARTPIRKAQRDTPRAQAKTTARVMAISDLLNPVIDREVEIGTVGSSEPVLERRLNSSSEESRVLPQSSPTSIRAETPEAEMTTGRSSGEDGSQTGVPGQKNNTGIRCQACSLTYSDKWSLRSHQTGASRCKPLTCRRCTRKFANQEMLAAHACRYNKKARCAVCKLLLATKLGLRRHAETQHAPKDLACPACKKGGYTRRGLEIHLASPTACKPFKCERCLRPFHTQELLESHTPCMYPGWLPGAQHPPNSASASAQASASSTPPLTSTETPAKQQVRLENEGASNAPQAAQPQAEEADTANAIQCPDCGRSFATQKAMWKHVDERKCSTQGDQAANLHPTARPDWGLFLTLDFKVKPYSAPESESANLASLAQQTGDRVVAPHQTAFQGWGMFSTLELRLKAPSSDAEKESQVIVIDEDEDTDDDVDEEMQLD